MATKFLVVMYMPCVIRQEQRNIGVIVWNPKWMLCRFVEPKKAKFIRDKQVYQRWVDYLTKIVTDKKELRLVQKDRTVTRVPHSDERYIKALCQCGKGNYALRDAGEMMDRVLKADSEACLNQMFKELVE